VVPPPVTTPAGLTVAIEIALEVQEPGDGPLLRVMLRDWHTDAPGMGVGSGLTVTCLEIPHVAVLYHIVATAPGVTPYTIPEPPAPAVIVTKPTEAGSTDHVPPGVGSVTLIV